MDALRHFQHAQTFRLLVQDLGGRLTVERLADHLSALADIVLDGALRRAGRRWWARRRRRRASRSSATASWAARSWATRPTSTSCSCSTSTPTIRTPTRTKCATRASAQRLNTWLTSTTPAGQLYDTDLRLRPDGAKGLLVSSLRGFRNYQREHAWTWEHQALTRARFVAGDARGGRRVRGGTRGDPAAAARRGAAARRRRRDARARCRRAIRTRRRSSTSSTTRAAWSTSSSPCSTWCSRTRIGTRC